jgi:hypothetical protein
MAPGSFLLVLALLVLVGLVVSQPFLKNGKQTQSSERLDPVDHAHSTLLAERDQILRTLKELDFDFALGKIPHEDYPIQRNYLLQRGVNIIQKLDQFQSSENVRGRDIQLKAAIAAQDAAKALIALAPGANGNGRKSAAWAAGVAVAAPDDELEVLLANRRRQRRDKATGFCPKCGSPHQQSDRFCPKCGAKIANADE